MARAVADLIQTGKTALALEAFAPGRFAATPR
jgi:glycine/D-amino acid oxidase-like deaminating enzyme